MFRKIVNKVREFSPKQLVIAGVFTLALAGAVGAGLAVNNQLNAAIPRDCDDNAILRCGAADRNEFVADARSSNGGTQKDIQTIYSHFGLTTAEYDRFASTARQGEFRRNGEVWVDGQKVMTSTLSLGRHNFGGSKPITIGGKTYYQGTPNQRWADGVQSIPVMVMFDGEGTVEVAIMNPCGNAAEGQKVKSGGACELLNKTPVNGKENTYTFTTNTSTFGLGKVVKVEYYVDGQLWRTETDPKKPVERTFTKDSVVEAKVYVEVPGKQQVVRTSVKCKLEIKFVEKEVFYVCKNLIATARDNTNRNFRFTVRTDQKNATVKDVDFTLDGKTTTTGVTTKDADGNIYKDYDFTDAVEHTISAKVNFVTHDGKTVTAKEACIAKVTPEKPPVCIHNPNLPPEHPDCKKPECPEKPGSGFPPGDARCKEELPKTGPAAGIVGLFAGASIFGGAAHKLYLRRRNSL